LLSIPIDDFHTSWVRHSRSWAKPRRNAFAGMLVVFFALFVFFDEKEKGRREEEFSMLPLG